MKKNDPGRSSRKVRRRFGILNTLRLYLSVIRILHKGLGAPRIIAAYIFFAFALLSLLFTIKLPVVKGSPAPTDWAKSQSRGITGLMIIVNLLVYGIIMNWRKGNAVRTAIRVCLIGLAFYLDTYLIRVVFYIITGEGTFS